MGKLVLSGVLVEYTESARTSPKIKISLLIALLNSFAQVFAEKKYGP